MSTAWSNEETFKFIDLYQSEPAIWDSNNALHKEKNKVNDAWNRIADSLQIPVSELKKKKETLMSAFRMHFKKKQDSIRSGMGEDEIYKPIWIFYDAMEAFLKGKYTAISVISTDEQRAVIGEQTEEETENPSDARNNTEPKDMNIKIPVQRRRSVKPPELEKADKKMSKAFNTLNQAILNKDQQNKKEDDCDLYGRLLASKLRKYSDNERQEIMYEIDGLLLKRRRNCSPQYVSSPSQIIISKRPSSSATSYSCPSPSSSWINRPSSSSNHYITSPIQSPSPIPPAQTPSPFPLTELPNASYTQEVVYQSPNIIHTPVPTIHIPEGSMQTICNELYSQTQSQSQNILADAYAKALNDDC
ncbi:uncharacterized protein LOC114362137 [Ostrinia furnacalis]|uniref:uncharacterized protein LOC114362137 n=1 Tax=Ostrinia furnacalis TaxID=93504 RepID=UPI00103891D1|nr:uncharacterized protein LOC114362137 [Ostrinia furnacalis]